MGDLVALFGFLVLLAAGGAAGWWLVRHPGSTAPGAGGWLAAHDTCGAVTEVSVVRRAFGRVVERRLLESIAADDRDYDAKLVAVLMQARVRASLLNSQDRLNRTG